MTPEETVLPTRRKSNRVLQRNLIIATGLALVVIVAVVSFIGGRMTSSGSTEDALTGDLKTAEQVVRDVVADLSNKDADRLYESTCGSLLTQVESGNFDPVPNDSLNSGGPLWTGGVKAVGSLGFASAYADVIIMYGELVYAKKIDDEIPWPVVKFALTKNRDVIQLCSITPT